MKVGAPPSPAVPAPQRDDLMPRRPRGLGLGFALAILAHVILIIALTVGLNWRSSDPAGVEAELWAAVPQVAAPRAVAPEPTPSPPPKPEPRPEPPQPAPPPPQAAPTPPAPDPQIVIEKARREKAEKEKAEREAEAAQARRDQAERERKQKEAQELKERQKERETQLALQEKQRQDQERKDQERKDQERKDQERKKAEQDRVEAAAREKARQETLNRIKAMAGATGDANATGSAARSAGPSAGYAGRIRAQIKPNILFNDTVAGNPVATVEVRCAPDGTIIGQRLLKSSGSPAWDDAVLRAVQKTQVLPRDIDGRVPSPMQIDFKPNE